jgi:hypothetical protein
MRRRDFTTLLGGACLGGAFLCGAVAAWPIAARAREPDGKRYLAALEKAKRDYEKIPHPSEAARSTYITGLVRLREKAARGNTGEWQAIDAEIKQHPAPGGSDGKALSGLLAGQWESPRHDYLYRADGTWTMLPADEGTTHGTWRIEGNQYFDTNSLDTQTGQYTIILITKNDLVFADKTGVFYEVRLRD